VHLCSGVRWCQPRREVLANHGAGDRGRPGDRRAPAAKLQLGRASRRPPPCLASRPTAEALADLIDASELGRRGAGSAADITAAAIGELKALADLVDLGELGRRGAGSAADTSAAAALAPRRTEASAGTWCSLDPQIKRSEPGRARRRHRRGIAWTAAPRSAPSSAPRRQTETLLVGPRPSCLIRITQSSGPSGAGQGAATDEELPQRNRRV